MRDAAIQPGQRGPFERPADRDPLMLELQRNRDGDEGERGAGDERQTPQVALAGRFDPQQRPQQEREHRSLDHGNDRRSSSSSPPATNARAPAKNAIALASTAARYGSRLATGARADHEWVGGEHRVERAGSASSCGHSRSRSARACHCRTATHAGSHRDRRDVAPPGRRRQREQRRTSSRHARAGAPRTAGARRRSTAMMQRVARRRRAPHPRHRAAMLAPAAKPVAEW